MVPGEEGEEEAVGVFAFEHEIDAEEGCGEDVDEVGEPEGHRGEEIAGGGVDRTDGALSDGLNAKPVGKGDSFEFGNDVGDALRELVGELAEVAYDGREAGGEEESEDASESDNQEHDCHTARRMVAADIELGNASDDGHENDGKEGADVKDQELFFEGPGKGEKKQDGDCEEDVAADRGAGALFVGGEVVGRWVGQPISPWTLAWDLFRGADCWDADSVRL